MFSLLAKLADKVPAKSEQLKARKKSNAECQARRRETRGLLQQESSVPSKALKNDISNTSMSMAPISVRSTSLLPTSVPCTSISTEK